MIKMRRNSNNNKDRNAQCATLNGGVFDEISTQADPRIREFWLHAEMWATCCVDDGLGTHPPSAFVDMIRILLDSFLSSSSLQLKEQSSIPDLRLKVRLFVCFFFFIGCSPSEPGMSTIPNKFVHWMY